MDHIATSVQSNGRGRRQMQVPQQGTVISTSIEGIKKHSATQRIGGEFKEFDALAGEALQPLGESDSGQKNGGSSARESVFTASAAQVVLRLKKKDPNS